VISGPGHWKNPLLPILPPKKVPEIEYHNKENMATVINK